MPIDTSNKFLVGVQDGLVRILRAPRGPLAPEEARVFAAYLVIMAAAADGKAADLSAFIDLVNEIEDS